MPALSDVINRFTTYVINPILLVIFALGFFLFIWGLVEFLWYSRDGHANENGKNHMIYGLLGMVVMVSVWGIIALINNTFGLGVNVNQQSGTASYNPDMSSLNSINSVNLTGH